MKKRLSRTFTAVITATILMFAVFLTGCDFAPSGSSGGEETEYAVFTFVLEENEKLNVMTGESKFLTQAQIDCIRPQIPEGQEFTGWYDTAGEKLEAGKVYADGQTFTAKFEEVAEITVFSDFLGEWEDDEGIFTVTLHEMYYVKTGETDIAWSVDHDAEDVELAADGTLYIGSFYYTGRWSLKLSDSETITAISATDPDAPIILRRPRPLINPDELPRWEGDRENGWPYETKLLDYDVGFESIVVGLKAGVSPTIVIVNSYTPYMGNNVPVRRITGGAFDVNTNPVCINLYEVWLPSSLVEIQYNAFLGCTRLRIIRYQGTTADFYNTVIDPSNYPFLNNCVLDAADGNSRISL